MSKKMKWSIAGVVGAGIVALVVLSAFKRDGGATEVRMESTTKRDLVASVTASGQIQPRVKVDLSADITGKIVRLSVKEGQFVKKGQFLLEIDPQQYEAALQRSQAALASSRAEQAQAAANLMQAQRNYERTAEIRKANPALVAEEQVEQLRTQAEVNAALADAAKFRVQQAEASVKDAQVALGKTTILAPMSGQVVRLNVEEGETAIQGTLNKDAAVLLTIADMSDLETKVRVDETDVSRINVGDSAVVEIDAFPDTTFLGRVVQISNSSVRGTGGAQATDQAIDYEVTISLTNAPPDTRPDFSTTAKVITATRQSVLAIPIIALTVRENEPLSQEDTGVTLAGRTAEKQVGKRDVEGVFVVGSDNKVSFRPVRVGIAGEKYFEVLSGLQEGERIVAGTYQAIRQLKDGTLVRETPTPTTTARKE